MDLRTKALLDDMFMYGGGNVYGPRQLKEGIDARGEWAQRYRANFEHVLAERTLSAAEYEDRTEISFDTDDELYDHLSKLHRYLFFDGPIP
ncbi:MAG: hypothetical protein CL814_05400 [Confluentimicrobium sp.]|jgi:hypothetical protein|uniref:hypothetical protein n=1 Tax=Actibacterium sp. TaxID=1872125 RepID=UPI000C3EAB48|nr:hypothetical protein [Actibacterium sp.]MBC56352.1 hypothetical protein [Actibacterium sp.]|tara:strand:- start:962 stop:1234 length:273 start_codon:yes stop_codon:yes gene_type:complete